MSLFEAIVLGIIQGLTEFLPVSSSGHLELAKYFFGDQSVASESMLMTVSLHAATALSTIMIFWKDILQIFRGLFQFKWNEETAFSLKIIISMIPAAIVGLLLEEQLEVLFDRQILLVALMLIITGILLFLADRAKRTDKKVSFVNALIIGIAQAIAILPGISRSGATISTSVLLGIDRERAARFSFLMVVPLILGKMAKDIMDGDLSSTHIGWMPLLAGFIAAFITGALACVWMIRLVKNSKLTYFSVYCFIVATLVILFWVGKQTSPGKEKDMNAEDNPLPRYNFQSGATLLIDKPKTWTSFDVVNKIRYKIKHRLGIKKIKVGHAGTLDPMATGLLIICTGSFTRKLNEFQGLPKVYTGTFKLGGTTPSFDTETKIDETFPIDHITPELLEEARQKFLGNIEQLPPMFSAIKVDGQPLYKKARKGQVVEVQARPVEIFDFDLTRVELPEVDFLVKCSKGTYIRSLAHDFGQAVHSGAYLTELRRTAIGPFTLEKAWNLDELVEYIENSPNIAEPLEVQLGLEEMQFWKIGRNVESVLKPSTFLPIPD